MGEPSIARCLFGLDPRSDRLQINSCSAVLRLMRSAIYLNNSIEGHEKLHENEEAAKLVVGNTIEREGEYWKITKVDVQIAVCALRPLDMLRVYLKAAQN
jgi:hypothetical protein